MREDQPRNEQARLQGSETSLIGHVSFSNTHHIPTHFSLSCLYYQRWPSSHFVLIQTITIAVIGSYQTLSTIHRADTIIFIHFKSDHFSPLLNTLQVVSQSTINITQTPYYGLQGPTRSGPHLTT